MSVKESISFQYHHKRCTWKISGCCNVNIWVQDWRSCRNLVSVRFSQQEILKQSLFWLYTMLGNCLRISSNTVYNIHVPAWLKNFFKLCLIDRCFTCHDAVEFWLEAHFAWLASQSEFPCFYALPTQTASSTKSDSPRKAMDPSFQINWLWYWTTLPEACHQTISHIHVNTAHPDLKFTQHLLAFNWPAIMNRGQKDDDTCSPCQKYDDKWTKFLLTSESYSTLKSCLGNDDVMPLIMSRKCVFSALRAKSGQGRDERYGLCMLCPNLKRCPQDQLGTRCYPNLPSLIINCITLMPSWQAKGRFLEPDTCL